MAKIIKPKMRKGSKAKWFGPKKPPRKELKKKEELRIKRNRLKTLLFPKCLPSQADLEAVYLGKVAPSSAGVVYDESGNSNNAQLVNSNCIVFDGVMSATIPSPVNWGIGKTLSFIAQLNVASQAYIFAVGNLGVQINVGNMYVYTGGAVRNVYHTITDDDFHKVEILRSNESDYLVTIDGVYKGTTGDVGELALNLIGKRAAGSAYTKKMLHASLTDAWEYNFSEGAGLTLYNTGTVGGNADLFGYTLGTIWGLQDVYHYNFLNGFDLYTHATLDDLRVPIGSVVTETGYTYISTNVAGIWHNNAESGINLPDTLKAVVDLDISDPLYYADFKSFYGLSGFSNTEEFKKKYLAFYNRDLTDAEIIKVQKCINMKDGVDVWHDSEGVVVYDSNGILATDN